MDRSGVKMGLPVETEDDPGESKALCVVKDDKSVDSWMAPGLTPGGDGDPNGN